MKNCVWLRPELVAQIEFAEFTPDGHLRHSKFCGLREDRESHDVAREMKTGGGSCYRLPAVCAVVLQLHLSSGEIKLLFNLQGDLPVLAPRYNIARSQEVPAIVHNDGKNQLKPMKWGLVPSWTPDKSIGNQMINARAETLTEKPSFKRLVQQRRCLIPANGFYEWRREGNYKVPVWIHLRNKEPFAFAGLWDAWRDVEGEMLHTFTIITTMPNALLRRIHNRMPVIFDNF